MEGHIWRLAEKVSDRAKARDLAGLVVTLKVKQADHKIITRRHTLRDPTQMADKIFREAWELYRQLGNPGPFRLVGVGISHLHGAKDADRSGDLLDPQSDKRAKAELATDKIRQKFGQDAIIKGRSLR